MAALCPIPKATEVVLAHRQDQVKAADRPLGEGVEPIEKVVDARARAVREEKLLDLIEVD